MSLIVRIQTSQGMHRLTFDKGPSTTYGDLQAGIKEKYGIEPSAQVLSYTPANDPKFLDSDINSNTLLSSINIKHGTIVYLILANNQIKTFKDQQKKEENNNNNKEEEEKKDNNNNNNNNQKFVLKPLNKKKENNDYRSVTIGTSKWVNDENHKMVDNGPKHVPFYEWIEERQKKYSKTQPWNIDPPKYDYKPVQMTNHIKFSDLPQNAVISRQPYRHCDWIVFKDSSPYFRFKHQWEQNSSEIQKAAYLIGKYEFVENKLFSNASKQSNQQKQQNESKKDDKQKNEIKKSKKLMCAKIYAIYEPPQRGYHNGVKLLHDPNEKLLDELLSSINMERVGWVISTLPRGDIKKYKGDIFMSGKEIFTAARLQTKYCNKNTNYSKFVSLIMHLGDKEDQAFQISDQGCSMIKNGLISYDEKDDGFMTVCKPPNNKIYLPAIINENKEIKKGESFLPDALLVNVIATISKKQEHIFNYVHFPTVGSIDLLKQHLIKHKNEEYHIALSDFCLLTYLIQILDFSLVQQIAIHVIQKKRFDDQLRLKVHAAFKVAVPGY